MQSVKAERASSCRNSVATTGRNIAVEILSRLWRRHPRDIPCKDYSKCPVCRITIRHAPCTKNWSFKWPLGCDHEIPGTMGLEGDRQHSTIPDVELRFKRRVPAVCYYWYREYRNKVILGQPWSRWQTSYVIGLRSGRRAWLSGLAKAPLVIIQRYKMPLGVFIATLLFFPTGIAYDETLATRQPIR
jgi:hypothetical protein